LIKLGPESTQTWAWRDVLHHSKMLKSIVAANVYLALFLDLEVGGSWF
jgi:hypothetical protein